MDGRMRESSAKQIPAPHKGLLLGTVFVSPLASCICYFSLRGRESGKQLKDTQKESWTEVKKKRFMKKNKPLKFCFFLKPFSQN